MTDPALPHRSSEDTPPDDRPSIAELQRMVQQSYGFGVGLIPIRDAAPVLIEIVAADLTLAAAADDAATARREWSRGSHTDREAELWAAVERAEEAWRIATLTRDDALAKVRP